MKKLVKVLISLAVLSAFTVSLASCSLGSEKKTEVETVSATKEVSPVLQGILDNLKTIESYNEYKQMCPNTVFDEKITDNSIVIDISGTDGVEGKYEYKLEGDYLTFTRKTDSTDYLGSSIFIYLSSAADNYLGMVPAVVTGYIYGLDSFGLENKYYITETDEASGTTTDKIYVAGKYDMPELDTMYINEKSLDYTAPLTDDHISGSVTVGKITAIYNGTRDSVDILFREYGSRDEMTYKSIMSLVAKLQPDDADDFAEEYTEFKETANDDYSVTFGVDEEYIAEHEFKAEDGYEYTIVRFGK